MLFDIVAMSSSSYPSQNEQHFREVEATTNYVKGIRSVLSDPSIDSLQPISVLVGGTNLPTKHNHMYTHTFKRAKLSFCLGLG